ncbi:hypothetical protein [Halosimplex pelagicum]|uniref:Uncharacterized protein n=1 Tax=Halosimplex pelagicum TaxID=869886 RepID=A0A7D5TI74_9EURY|nr:hypothetical protein [Halosimplex pelagicum]QLH83596.1 hypothetical protein HZS54_19025 [Halosimplex pelagicum]
MTRSGRPTLLLCICLLLFALVAGYPFGIDAEQRALDAEERYLSAEFENASCVESWGTSSPVVEEESSVVNRTGDGAYVEVSHPYFYGTDSDEVDGASEAVYRVTADNETRVSGDTVVPC